MKKLVIFILFTAFSNILSAQKLSKPPQEIKAVYFQHWSAGVEMGGSGTDFYIEFKKPITKDIVLTKLYFNNRVTKLEKVSETMYIGHYFQRPEMIIDENGNKNIVHKTPETDLKYNLKEKEAVIEFVKSKKNRIYKFKNIKEKEYLAYPSAPPKSGGN
jgi:hypothetical protein